MENKRLLWVDLIKCFLIVLVIWGHLIQYYGVGIQSIAWKAIYSFHMPLFMLLSGMFFSVKQSFWQCINSRLSQCLFPGVTASIVLFLVDQNGLTIGEAVKGMFTNLWFLKCLLLCTLFYYPIKKGGKWKYIGVAILCAFYLFVRFNIGAGNIYSIDVVDKIFNMFGGAFSFFYLLPFFATGDYLHSHNTLIYIKRKKVLIAILLILFFCLLHFFSSEMTVYFSASVFPLSSIHHFQRFICTSIYRYLIGFVGCLLFLLIAPSLVLCEENSLIKLMSNVGKQTLPIYVLQSFVVEWNIFHIPYESLCGNRLIIPILAVGVSVLLYGVALLIRKQKIVSLLLIGSR